MKKKDLHKMTNEELLVEKKNMKNSKIFSAILIGFLGGILAMGVVSFCISSNKNIVFLLPMLFLSFMIYKLIKKPNEFKDLEELLKERNLN